MKVGDTIKISVFLAGTPVQVSDIGIIFDPDYFTLGNVVNGNVYDRLTKVDKNIDVQKSRPGYLFVAAAISGDNPTYRTGEIFSFELTAKKTVVNTLVTFDSKRTIAAFPNKDLLDQTNSLELTINQ